MRTVFSLNRDGAVTTYLTTRPKVVDFNAPYTLKDQLRFEKEMRDLFYESPEKSYDELVADGDFTYYAANRNPYVDYSKFYFTLKRVTFSAKTTLVSDKAKNVRARVWSYAAFDMWVNGDKVATEKVPVYQPIRYTDLTLSLAEGENDVFFFIQNFGVRDTRNMLKLQLIDTDGISVTLPLDDAILADYKACEEWLLSLRINGSSIISPSKAPFFAELKIGDNIISYDGTEIIDVGVETSANVNVTLHNTEFLRRLEFAKNFKTAPSALDRNDINREVARKALELFKYGKVSPKELYKESGHGSMNLMLASLYLKGELDEYDEGVIRESLEYINTRNDCADFELADLLYATIMGKVKGELLEEVHKVALNFRYWMDEEGADAMCFWSENHCLTFYGCQAMAGMLWPDDVFVRSGRLGREQVDVGKRRMKEWFDTVLTEGFEEFLASGYMAVTVAILLKIYDLFDGELRTLAARTVDEIAMECAVQCYKGVFVAPMGRVYRGAIRPYQSGVQSMLAYLSGDNADASYVRMSNFLFTSYKFPKGLEKIMKGDVDTVFNSGRAEIHTRKSKDTILTSVASPRTSEPPHVDNTDTENYRTKIMNESFHGTSLFIPGKGGYQQHLWYAGISDTFLCYVSLPGSERDFDGMRPGYWYGNLVFPYVKQVGREIFTRYIIPDSVPTTFTHAFFPAALADEVRAEGNFRFARVGESYLALFSSLPLEEYGEDALADAELRAYGDDVIWYVKVGSKNEDGSFDAFASDCLQEVSADYCLEKLK